MRPHDHLILRVVVVTYGQSAGNLGREIGMREFLVAVAAAIVIAVVGFFALDAAQRSAETQYHSTTGVRM